MKKKPYTLIALIFFFIMGQMAFPSSTSLRTTATTGHAVQKSGLQGKGEVGHRSHSRPGNTFAIGPGKKKRKKKRPPIGKHKKAKRKGRHKAFKKGNRHKKKPLHLACSNFINDFYQNIYDHETNILYFNAVPPSFFVVLCTGTPDVKDKQQAGYGV
ncbi:MAG: hypothetical protein GXO89_01250 [Chlorobi bacterium]|nr:hypothetical protein [Chlorobiota bacterium]